MLRFAILWLSVAFLSIPLVSSAQSKPFKVIFSTPNALNSQHVFCAIQFKALAEKYSNGRLEIELHFMGGPKPNIGSDEDNARAISQGTGLPHVAILAVNNATVYAPILGFMTLPYIFPEPEDAIRLFQSNFMKHDVQQSMIESGNFRALGWLVGGYRHLTNSKKEVFKLSDLSGLKIRTPQNPIMLATYHAFGAEVMPIKWTDLFDAMKNGTVDGQENPYTLIADQKFWKANQKYATENGPILWIGPLLISERFYQSLPPDLQLILDKAGAEAASLEWQWVVQKNLEAKKVMLANGMKIVQPTDKEEWMKAAKKVWPRFYELVGNGNAKRGQGVIDKALAVINNK